MCFHPTTSTSVSATQTCGVVCVGHTLLLVLRPRQAGRTDVAERIVGVAPSIQGSTSQHTARVGMGGGTNEQKTMATWTHQTRNDRGGGGGGTRTGFMPNDEEAQNQRGNGSGMGRKRHQRADKETKRGVPCETTSGCEGRKRGGEHLKWGTLEVLVERRGAPQRQGTSAGTSTLVAVVGSSTWSAHSTTKGAGFTPRTLGSRTPTGW